MANNRVFLRSKSDHDKKLTLFKYYPSTGWYLYATKKEINKWFDEYINDGSQWGNTDFEFVFETIEDEIVKEKRNIYEITYSFLDDLKFTLTAPLEIVDDLFKEDIEEIKQIIPKK